MIKAVEQGTVRLRLCGLTLRFVECDDFRDKGWASVMKNSKGSMHVMTEIEQMNGNALL